MICSSCGVDNNGVTIKGSLFCAECGNKMGEETAAVATEQLSDTPDPIVEPKEALPSTPKAQVISRDGEIEKELSLLEAEVAALDYIDEEAIELTHQKLDNPDKLEAVIKKPISNIKESKIPITKAHRAIVMPKNKAGFQLFKNEPDPLTQPELEAPHDMIIEKESNEGAAEVNDTTPNTLDLSKKTELKPDTKVEVENTQDEPAVKEATEEAAEGSSFDALQSAQRVQEDNIFVKRSRERAEKEAQELQEFSEETNSQEGSHKKSFSLATIFKKSTKKSSTIKKKRKEKKTKAQSKYKKLKITLALITALAIITFLAIGFYVNMYALNPQKTIERLKSQTSFSFKEPAYLPPGYSINPTSNATDEKINLVYDYTAAEKKSLTITLETSSLNNEQLFDDRIKNSGSSYLNFESENISYWYIDSSKLLFINKNYLYEISSSSTMSKEELLRIAKGL